MSWAFLLPALAGTGVALMAGPLGCVMVWRRMSYFGDMLAHAALLGAALAFLLASPILPAIFVFSALLAGLLYLLQRRQLIPSDALLGLFSHSCLALGLIFLALFAPGMGEMEDLLLGDILEVSLADMGFIYAGAVVSFTVLARIWPALIAAAMDEDIAAAENMHPLRAHFLFTLLLALLIAAAIELTGILLVTALLIIPACAARGWSSTPEQMAIVASAVGVCSVLLGLGGAFLLPVPAGAAIIVVAAAFFVVSLVSSGRARGEGQGQGAAI